MSTYADEMRWEWAPIHPGDLATATIPELLAAKAEVIGELWEPYEFHIRDEWLDRWQEEMADRFAPWPWWCESR